MDMRELNPTILSELDESPGRSGFEGYLVQLFDELKANEPFGLFEIALNPRIGVACAVYEAEDPGARHLSSPVLVSTEPIWFAASSPQSAADLFYEILVDHAVEV
ncbi:hypothetical protein M728_001077 [Ensifer sp. WSM1721]|uniref:hypothetical protein n=1 Tax=Ensifer sp. WSM1721 TaxID=1041159 RepID=UPI00047CD281|nr:hypothetical protein [Ensifer sp. WSM1721]